MYSLYIDFIRGYEEIGIEQPYTVYNAFSGEYIKQESGDEYDELYAVHVTPCILKSEYKHYELDDISGLDIVQ